MMVNRVGKLKKTLHLQSHLSSIVYLLENNYNNTAAWVTEHLECVVAGNVDKMVLQQIVNSTQDDIRKDVDK